ncbi:MAG: NADP-dependent phosphogluconate dehydrogenase [Nitriliruptorales bacterium]|nr:NADP-dependent phosphogluconate dehydrogenase [Nitriliruptorales bacterium]
MKFGIAGLGRMGHSLGTLAIEHGHEVVGWDPSDAARERARSVGLETADDLRDLAGELPAPRVVLMWVPHGEPVDQNLSVLGEVLGPGDVVADCGNSQWEESRRRHATMAERDVQFLDIGTSGGISDALGWKGAAFMVGGPRAAFDVVAPLLRSLAVDDGAVFYAGASSAGHFVKLVHNAIEFGMIQAIAEGVELLQAFDEELDVPAVFEHWNHGTVIRSWLVELMGNALRDGAIGAHAGMAADFDLLSTFVEDTGEVNWVLHWAAQRDVPTPVTTVAQQMLMAYRNVDWPAAKAVALLRNQFGGHPIRSLDVPRR